MNDFIEITPNCPKCRVPLSLFDPDLPCGTLWMCNEHLLDTGLESVYLTLPDVDAVLRDPAAWDTLVAEQQAIERRWGNGTNQHG